MKRTLLVIVALFIFVIPLLVEGEATPNYASFRRDIQRIFAGEVIKKNISALSQSARMLGLLEFMDQSRFPEFSTCMQKYPKWGQLPPTNRERAIESCQASARPTATLGPSPASIAERAKAPESSIVEVRLVEVLSRLNDLDQKVSSIQEGQSQFQEAMTARQEQILDRRPTATEEIPLEEELIE
ncbi:hypothetical protein ACFLRA_02410 [Bdellovibrionota bacterium]